MQVAITDSIDERAHSHRHLTMPDHGGTNPARQSVHLGRRVALINHNGAHILAEPRADPLRQPGDTGTGLVPLHVRLRIGPAASNTHGGGVP